jgi:hypothetical protein
MFFDAVGVSRISVGKSYQEDRKQNKTQRQANIKESDLVD